MSYFEKPVDGAVAQQTDDAYLAYSGCHFIAGGAKSIRGHTGCPRASTVQGAHECRCKAPPSPKAGRWSLALARMLKPRARYKSMSLARASRLPFAHYDARLG